MKTPIYIFAIFILAIIILFSSCDKDDKIILKEKVTGFVQKGPYINGTTIDIVELNASLGQTGKVFNTTITNNKGSFEIDNIELSSQYVEFKALGFYFNEITGDKSIAQFALNALSDLTDISTVNVNILTHLEESRVKDLVNKGIPFLNAKDSAQKEVLAIFGFVKNNMNKSEMLDISVNNDDNAILLAISVILQGNRSVADLTEIMANIITDIKEDGTLNDIQIISSLYNSALDLDLAKIRGNLEKRYQELEVEASIPDFEQYVNSYLSSKSPFDVDATVTNVSCNGLNNGKIEITITGGTPPFSYFWSNGVATKNISGLSSGFYSVLITDSRNFNQKKNIQITEPQELLITGIVTNNTTENNNRSLNVTVSGGSPPYQYSWSNGSSTEDINNLSNGHYTVAIVDANQCLKSREFIVSTIVSDIDGNSYNTVIIGTQLWMVENLKTTKYSNGDLIGTTDEYMDVSSENSPKYQWAYKCEEGNVATYGRLYTWYAVTDSRNICPAGWHVPTLVEMGTLIDYLGGGLIAGGKLKEAGSVHWDSPNTGATNSSGFTALPGGYRGDLGGFSFVGTYGFWWSSTECEFSAKRAYNLWIDWGNMGGMASRSDNPKQMGLSVRCLHD